MARFLTAGAPSGTDLVLLKMSGREELSRLPEFQLEFTSPKSGIEAKLVLGKNLSWSFELANGEQRYFNGFVTRFSEVGELGVASFDQARKGKAYLYRATVNPWLWFLTRASHSRMWENMTVVDVVQHVVQSYAADLKLNLKGAYARRKYIVQYRETDFNFVCRLLEQEGIYFAFEYANGKNTWVLMNSGGTSAFEVPFHHQSHGATSKDHISSWGVSREIQPGKYSIVDYNYLKPSTPWTGEQPMAEEHALANFEMVDYPGGEYDDALEGPGQSTQWLDHYAKTRIEELHARYEIFSGGGNERRCAPGRLMKLQDHDRAQYNNEYLITSVSYSASAGDLASTAGGGAEFRCSVSAVSSKTAFRPARITPKPVIQGTQTAIVANWEEPAEGLGRVKLKFHWNQESTSCWVRVAQPLAGNKWGFVGIPRPGDEVVVEFLEGDPDRPLVIGCVYNAESMPPWTLPSERAYTGFKSCSWGGGGFNELRFDDTAGKEEIYIRAQNNKTILVEKDRCETVGKESHLKVASDVFEDFGAKHHVKVASDRNENVGGSLSLKVGTDLLGKAGTKIAYDAGSEIHLKAGSTLVLEAGATLSLKVGGNFITIDQSGVAIKGIMVQINTGGAAGTGSGASPTSAEAPKEAHPSEGGKENKAPQKKTVAAPAAAAPSGTVAPAASAAPAASPQAEMFRSAAESGTPFCEICNCPPA